LAAFLAIRFTKAKQYTNFQQLMKKGATKSKACYHKITRFSE
jgi:hypothetical protein